MSSMKHSLVHPDQGPKPDTSDKASKPSAGSGPSGKNSGPAGVPALSVPHPRPPAPRKRLYGCETCRREKWLPEGSPGPVCWGQDCSATMTLMPGCSQQTKARKTCGNQARPGTDRCKVHPAPDDDGQAPANVLSLDDAREIHGLNQAESIAHTFRFDGDVWHLLAGQHETGARWQRSVKVGKATKGPDGEETVSFVPLLPGRVILTARRSVVTVDPKSRKLSDGQESSAYDISYQDENYITVAKTVVHSIELNYEDKGRRFGFLDRLALCERVQVKHYDSIRDLIKAVIGDARNTVPVIKVVDHAGILYIDGQLCYANPTGTVIGPGGRVRDDVICHTKSAEAVYSDIHYLPSSEISDKDALAGLDSLADLLNGYQDKGVSGIGLGILAGSLLSGTELPDGIPVGCLAALAGDTMSGKTSFVMLLITSSTRTRHGKVRPPFTGSITPNRGSGGATPPGIFQSYKHYGGCVGIVDDVIKTAWPTADKEKAHNTIISITGNYVVSGGSAQATVNKMAGGVEKAAPLWLGMNMIYTMEEVSGITGTIMKDSVYNRMAFAWWDKDKRCDDKTFRRLSSARETLSRNTGLSYMLGMLLAEPGILADGYDMALSYFRKRFSNSRIAESYARALMGLHVLDVAYARLGRPGSHILADVMPGALAQAKILESWGTHGGDEKAAGDSVEAVREVLAGLLAERYVYASAPADPADRGKALVPQPPRDLPGDTDCTSAGWGAEGYGDDGAATWKPRVNALHIGEIIPRNPKARPARFAYRLEMTHIKFMALVEKLNEVANRKHYATTSRDLLIEKLTEAGVLNYVRSNGMSYQVDWEWVISRGEGN